MKNYTFRLKSGQGFFDAIDEFEQEKSIRAGCVLAEIAPAVFEDAVYKGEGPDDPRYDELVIYHA